MRWLERAPSLLRHTAVTLRERDRSDLVGCKYNFIVQGYNIFNPIYLLLTLCCIQHNIKI